MRRRDPITDTLLGFGFPRAAADRLTHGGTPMAVAAGTTLCTEGERGLQAFVVLRGEAQVLRHDEVITLGPGAVVGEQATLDLQRTRNATVVAGTDLEVLVFDPRTFVALAHDPDLHDHLVPRRAA